MHAVITCQLKWKYYCERYGACVCVVAKHWRSVGLQTQVLKVLNAYCSWLTSSDWLHTCNVCNWLKHVLLQVMWEDCGPRRNIYNKYVCQAYSLHSLLKLCPHTSTNQNELKQWPSPQEYYYYSDATLFMIRSSNLGREGGFQWSSLLLISYSKYNMSTI